MLSSDWPATTTAAEGAGLVEAAPSLSPAPSTTALGTTTTAAAGTGDGGGTSLVSSLTRRRSRIKRSRVRTLSSLPWNTATCRAL